MEYGYIKDTTIQDIADGLRDKGVIPKYKKDIFEFVRYKSPNATSLTNPTPTGGLENVDQTTIEILEADSLELHFTLASNMTEKDLELYPHAALGNIGIANKDGTQWYIFSESLYADSDFEFSITVPVNNCFVQTVSLGSFYYGWVVEAYPLDKNGERITVERDNIFNSLTPAQIAEAIDNCIVPPPSSAFVLTGSMAYRFRSGNWDWFLDTYSDFMSTLKITDLGYAFQETKASKIPFVINVDDAYNFSNAFGSARQLTECPKIRGTIKFTTSTDFQQACYGLYLVKDMEDFLLPEMLDGFSTVVITSSFSCPKPPTFGQCYCLRKVPSWWYKFRINENSTSYTYPSYAIYSGAFNYCSHLDEVLNMPVLKCNATASTDMFYHAFNQVFRMARVTFETDNGAPIVTQWKSQVIDLTTTGYTNGSLPNEDQLGLGKKVTDDASYQALKDDPDWWTGNIKYSRYNHDSAVETINSLPDCSATGTNTIKFKKAAGSKTDGGAIENLTAEEIAVAAAKGWTVTLS